MRPHRRQFIIGPTECKFSQDTMIRKLNCGSILSYDRELPIHESTDGNIIILGSAFCSKTAAKSEELVNLVTEVEEITKTWVGRWILYFKGELYSDITTSLSLFYTKSPINFWVSSSASLLSKVDNSISKKELVFKEPNFLPATTCINNVKQVMIAEKVNLQTGSVEWQGFSPLFTVDYDDDRNTATLSDRLKTAGKSIASDNLNVYSALTSGQDSRLDLAVLLKTSPATAFRTYTFVKRFLFMSPGDRDLPPQISKKFGFNHLQIKERKQSDNIKSVYSEHCWTFRSTEPGSPFYYFLNGYWEQLPLGCTNIDHCYEIGRNFLYDNGSCGLSPDFTYSEIVTDGYQITIDDYYRLNEYFQKIKNNFKIDRRNLLYLYKCYPFFGKLFQAQDLWVNSMFMGNSREIFSILLSVSTDMRTNGRFHRNLVSYICRELDQFPYSPDEPLWQKVFLRIVSRLRRIPK